MSQISHATTSGPAPDTETLTGNTGGAVGPDASFNIDFTASGGFTVTGDPLSNSLDMSPTGWTAGSVVFASSSTVFSQDNANFFWDDINNVLGLGTNTPGTGDCLLDIGGYGTSVFGGNSTVLRIKADTNTISGVEMTNATIGGAADFRFTIVDENVSAINFALPSTSNVAAAIFGLSRQTNAFIFTTNLRGLGIGSLDAQQLRFGTNNTPRMTVESNATRVGIGVTSPASILNTYENTTTEIGASNLGIVIEQDGTGDAALQFLLTGSQRWAIGIDNSLANDPLVFNDTSVGIGVNFIEMNAVGEEFLLVDHTAPAAKIGFQSAGGSPLTGRIIGYSTGGVKYTFQEFLLGGGGGFNPGNKVFFNTDNTTRMTLHDNGLYIKPAAKSTTPSAYLHLAAGTASASTAPLKFTTGTLLSSPEGGAVEYDGSFLYYTDSTNTRHQLESGSTTHGVQNITTSTATAQVEAVNIANDPANLVTITLPATAAIGDYIEIAGNSSNGWVLAQNAGQTVHFNTADTTTGVGGSLASTNRYDCVKLVCTVANTDFVIQSSSGNITVT